MHVLSSYQAITDIWGVKTSKENGLHSQEVGNVTGKRRHTRVERDLTIQGIFVSGTQSEWYGHPKGDILVHRYRF